MAMTSNKVMSDSQGHCNRQPSIGLFLLTQAASNIEGTKSNFEAAFDIIGGERFGKICGSAAISLPPKKRLKKFDSEDEGHRRVNSCTKSQQQCNITGTSSIVSPVSSSGHFCEAREEKQFFLPTIPESLISSRNEDVLTSARFESLTQTNNSEFDLISSISPRRTLMPIVPPNFAARCKGLQKDCLQEKQSMASISVKKSPTFVPQRLLDQNGRNLEMGYFSSSVSTDSMRGVSGNNEAEDKKNKDPKDASTHNNLSALSELRENFLKDQQRRLSKETNKSALAELRASCDLAIQQAGFSVANSYQISGRNGMESENSTNDIRRKYKKRSRNSNETKRNFVIVNNAIYYNLKHSPQNHLHAKTVLMELQSSSEMALKQAGLYSESEDRSSERVPSTSDAVSVRSFESYSSLNQSSDGSDASTLEANNSHHARSAVDRSRIWKKSLYQAYVQALGQ